MDSVEEHARACAEMMEAMSQVPGVMGGMGGMGMMGGMGGLMAFMWALIPLAILALLAVIAILLMRVGSRWEPAESAARTAADARYARGELTREEYLAMRRDLESGG